MYNAKIITFSPIHIGDGEELISLEYIEGEKEVKVYPFYYLIDKLYEKYEDKIETIAPRLKMFAKKGELSKLEDFFSNLGVHLEPKYVLSKKVSVNGNKIKTFIKNMLGPYIPGSEIKGALRTIFFYGILSENQELKEKFYNKLKEILNNIERDKANQREREKKFKTEEKNLEAWIFRSKIDGEKEGENAQYDIFKAVQVFDSESVGYDNLYVDSVKVLNSRRPIEEYGEFLPKDLQINFKIKIDQNAIEGLKKFYEFKKDFSNENLERVTFEFLKKSAINFYKKLIENEKEFIEKRLKNSDEVKNSIKNQLEKLLKFIEGCEKSPKIVFPLRLGKHQGYLSLTIMQLVKEENKDLFEKVFKYSVQFVREEVNKTRKILGSESILPGWCFIYIDDKSKEV
ncbi:MAG: type III-A CRISPR-associated RAMP protein Csm5 [Caldimicrobium sp.]